MSDIAPSPSPVARSEPPLRVGEHFGRKLSYSVQQIADFARLSLDSNPLHQAEAAGSSAYAGVIASGQQTVASMMGLMASHFTRHGDGPLREMLCLNVNFAFKAPVRADAEIDMRWVVSAVDYNAQLKGWIAQLNGSAYSAGTDCVIGRATVLVKRPS